MGLVEGASYHRSNHPEACQPCFWQGWRRSWSPYVLNQLLGGDRNDKRYEHLPSCLTAERATDVSTNRYRQTRYPQYSITDSVPVIVSPRWAFEDARLTNWAKRAQWKFENANIREMRPNSLSEVVPFKNQLASSRQLTNIHRHHLPRPLTATLWLSASNTRHGTTPYPKCRPEITPLRCKSNP